MDADHDYFARRAAEERVAAAQAASIQARTAHLELAGRYADLAQSPADFRVKAALAD